MLTAKNSITMSRTKVFKDDKMTVYATAGSKHMKPGKAYEVHKLHGEKLIADGKATATPGEKAPKTKKGGEV